MTDLTGLTIAEIRDGLGRKEFSATELTRAYLATMEAARELNVYIVETPEKALASAGESDARIARGDMRPLEGVPLGIKDLFCTEGVHSQADRHRQSVARWRIDAGQAQHG
jgi:aspartyl-tRNA(Asn)/glutamyl-tRNA(Gln) amidotransferase subunit A